MVHGLGGAGDRTSLIVKSPSASRGTPVILELEAVALAAGPQKRVAKTLCPPFVPMPLPPRSSKPCPNTRIRPSTLTVALRSAILQIWPAGETPRTIFGEAVVVVPLTVTLEIGSTPMPPLNCTSVSSLSS